MRLPVMICEDGFITSHALENIELESDEAVKAFVGEYHPENYLLKHENPWRWAPTAPHPYYMEARVAQAEAMKNAKGSFWRWPPTLKRLLAGNTASLRNTAWRTPRLP